MEEAFYENNNYNDQQFSHILAVLEELDQRLTRVEEAMPSTPAKEPKSKQVETEVYVTKASLKKVRDAIMGIFR